MWHITNPHDTMDTTLRSAIDLAISQASHAAMQAFEGSLEKSCERLQTMLARSLDRGATSAFRPVPGVSTGARGARLAGHLALGGSSPPPAHSAAHPPRITPTRFAASRSFSAAHLPRITPTRLAAVQPRVTGLQPFVTGIQPVLSAVRAAITGLQPMPIGLQPAAPCFGWRSRH